MSSGFYYPTQAAPTVQWISAKPPVLPACQATDYPEQLTGETAGGNRVVQDKGPVRETFELKFERIPESDRDAALSFFTTVKKAFNTFEYQDAAGALHTVRWTNSFEFHETVPGRYSGNILLRKE